MTPQSPIKTTELGYFPKCPICKQEALFDVSQDERTEGANGIYEIITCNKCHCVVGFSLANAALVDED